jgi:hypothetical protein
VEHIGESVDEAAPDVMESADAQTMTTRAIENGDFILRTTTPSTSAI